MPPWQGLFHLHLPTLVFGLLNVRSLSNKSFFCHDDIVSKQFDLFMLTETWLNPGDCVALNETCQGFNYFQQSRNPGHGVGVAVIHRDNFKCFPYTLGNFSSFESVGFMINAKAPLCFNLQTPKIELVLFRNSANLLIVMTHHFDRVVNFNMYAAPVSSYYGFYRLFF